MRNALIPLTNLDGLLDSFFGPSRDSLLQGGNGGTLPHLPMADVLEGEKDFRIQLDLPGVDRESLKIEVEDQTLRIAAERTQAALEGYTVRRKELPGKISIQRSFQLGKEIDHERITARLEDGVLTVTLPKAEVALPRRIEVK
jgi:HSP20 family protein